MRAVFVANEDHAARHTGRGKHRGVVSGAARYALGGQAEPSRQFEQMSDPTLVEARRRRFEAAVELEPYLALVGHRLALRVEQLVELPQRLAALAAHFEAERQFARDARHRMRTRIG